MNAREKLSPGRAGTIAHEIGSRLLREARRAAGVSQVELAERIGESQSEVSMYERGERRLDVVQLRTICADLDTPLADFVADWEGRLRQSPPLRGRRKRG